MTRLGADRWLHASGLILGMMLIGNAANYVFHALASRALGPAEYGALVSLLALLTVLAVPSQAVQMMAARWVSIEQAEGRSERIFSLLGPLLREMLLLGLGMALVLVVSAGFWKQFLHLSHAGPIGAVAVTAVVMLALPVVRGALQGFQSFGWLGFNLLADGLLRLAFGAAFFAWAWGLTGGIAASAAAGATAFGLAAWSLRGHGTQDRTDLSAERRALYTYGLPVLLNLGAFTAIAALDVIMVKHFYPAQASGYYGAGSLVGKAFLFLPLALTQVLFPKVSAGHAQQQNVRPWLWRSLGLTLGLIGLGWLGVQVLAPAIVRTLFGLSFLNPQTLWLVRGYGLAVTPLALTYILLQYSLAKERTTLTWVLLADIPVLLLLLASFHATLEQTLWVTGLNHLAVFLAGGASLWQARRG